MHPSLFLFVCKYGSQEYLYELIHSQQYPIEVLQEGMSSAHSVQNAKNAMLIMGYILSSTKDIPLMEEEYESDRE